ncbi:MAG TPA: HD domain-containing protein, partial [bacterium]|nr:HD domain-containing protein [bacterium]
IRVNPLACKVMAYYHDIGKLHGPHYYVENQSSFNIHDTLEPAESARIIKSHIAYGLELAREHKLGEKIEAAIRQHHGTSLVKFFYEKATQRDPRTPEADYRYIGPKPQAKDVGLIMLADSVEAAIRSMKEKNYQKISEGVHNIIARIITDGQLSDCNMTMRDLALIEESFIKTLAGQYHARVEYQQPVA